MTRLAFIVLFTIFLISTVTGQTDRTPLLVSTEWLSQHLGDSHMVVLQVANIRAEYNSGHIPGARFLWYSLLTPSTPEETNTLPVLEQAAKTLEDLGVSNDSRIILCGSPGAVATVTRSYVMLEYLGLAQNVSILNGGLDAWKAERRPLSTKNETPPSRGSLNLSAHPSMIVDAGWVKANLNNSAVTVVDARAKNVYDGTPGSLQKTGHIAGAKNVNLSSLVDSLNRFKPLDEVRKAFSAAGVLEGTKVVTYCTTGQLATATYLAARILGFDAAVYDGSWEDWSLRGDDFPVEISKKEKGNK